MLRKLPDTVSYILISFLAILFIVVFWKFVYMTGKRFLILKADSD